MPPTPTDWLARSARSDPNGIAIRDGKGRELTYGALAEQALAAAPALARSCPAHATCVLDLAAGLDHAVAMHAAMLCGRRFQTLRSGLPAAERRRALDAAGEHLLIDRDWIESLVEEPGDPGRGAPPRADAVLSRVLTSGTSGQPRAVDLTFANHHAAALASADRLGRPKSGELWLCCLPLDHVGGLTILVRSVIYGSAALVHDRFDADAVGEALAEGGVSHISLVATQLRRLLEADAPIERPRVVLVGGGPLPDDLLAAALDRDAAVVQTYGLTEACSQVCTLAPGEVSGRRGSAGRPLRGVEVRIDGAAGQRTGEVLVSGPTVAPGAAPDGVLRTGDLGRLDDDGYLWVEGRSDDLIVSGGEKVRPEEVEDALRTHPGVWDAGVFGRTDPEWGEAVCAVVVPAPGHSLAAERLRAHCRERLAAHKVPKTIELVAELPRTAAGKLLRRELR